MKLWGVNIHFAKGIELQSIEITKETPKLYYTKKQVSWLDYRDQTPKDHRQVFLSPEAAIRAFIGLTNEIIIRLEKELQDENDNLEQARRLNNDLSDT